MDNIFHIAKNMANIKKKKLKKILNIQYISSALKLSLHMTHFFFDTTLLLFSIRMCKMKVGTAIKTDK